MCHCTTRPLGRNNKKYVNIYIYIYVHFSKWCRVSLRGSSYRSLTCNLYSKCYIRQRRGAMMDGCKLLLVWYRSHVVLAPFSFQPLPSVPWQSRSILSSKACKSYIYICTYINLSFHFVSFAVIAFSLPNVSTLVSSSCQYSNAGFGNGNF